MKNLSLLIVAGALATTFSGCYIDRTPTMTMEERSMASDKEIAEYEAKKAAEGSKKSASVEAKATGSKDVEKTELSAEEYSHLLGRDALVNAFKIVTPEGKGGWARFFIKFHDLKNKVRLVEPLGVVGLRSSADPVMLVTELSADGFRAFSGTIRVRDSSSLTRRYVELTGSTGMRAEGDRTPGTALRLPSGAACRFVVRNFAFPAAYRDEVHSGTMHIVATEGLVFEIECIVTPFGDSADVMKESERLQKFIEAEWALPVLGELPLISGMRSH